MSSIRKKIHKAETSYDKVKFKIKEALNLFDPVIIYPYRGYGNGKKIYIEGRILEKEHMIHGEGEENNNLWNNLRKIWKRYESDEIPGVGIEADMKGVVGNAVSDEDGFFKLEFDVPPGKHITDGWHEAILRITEMPFDLEFEETATTWVNICNQNNCFGIISDVDDTIIKSEAMNSLKKVQIMLTQNAQKRVSFKGVDKLYHRLVADGRNPLFFVSGSSWNLYDMLIDFCEHQNIPKAPFLLRNLGLNPDQWLKKDTGIYKKQYITHLMQVFNRMPFMLIGDSGQKDPEIYIDIYKQFPEQVKAIYIRHVHTDKRKQELKKMARGLDVPFLLLHDSAEVLEHAVDMEWID